MSYTNDELERIWYNLGNTTLAQAYGELADLEGQSDNLQDELDTAQEDKARLISNVAEVLNETFEDFVDKEAQGEAIRKILDNS